VRVLSETKMVPRRSVLLSGVIAIVYTTIIAWVIWAIFADPRGPPMFRYYTPLFWFSIACWLFLSTTWMHVIFEDYPFARFGPKKKGALMIPISVVIAFVCYFIFMWYIYGWLGVPYFSWPKLESLGLTPLIAREYSSYANSMAVFVATFTMLGYSILFRNWPWEQIKQPARGLAVFAISGLLAAFLFQILFHPHFGEAFPVSQMYFAAAPWWKDLALSYHGNFIIAWYMWAIVYVILSGTIWEGRPWIVAKKQPWIGIFGFLAIIGISWLTMYLCLSIMDIMLGPAIPGGKRSFGLIWRYLHTAEIAGFIIPPALYLYYFFDNWPKRFSVEINWLIRTFIVFFSGWIISLLYYSIGPATLGVPTSWDADEQISLVWVVWWCVLILWSAWFMDRWPAYKVQKIGA